MAANPLRARQGQLVIRLTDDQGRFAMALTAATATALDPLFSSATPFADNDSASGTDFIRIARR